MTVLLDIDGLSIDFLSDSAKLRAVSNVNLQIRRGEIVGLVGESGCGKSVTANALMRLHDENRTSYQGHIWFDGKDVLALSKEEMRGIRGGHISMIFQDPQTSLNPVMRIRDQMAEVVRLRAQSKGDSSQASSEIAVDALLHRTLADVGLVDAERVLAAYPHQLSGGMKQRVMIGIALLGKPDLLIADEPTTALDVTTQAQILDLLLRLREEHDMAVILISHDLGVIAQTCDSVAVMYLGQIVEYAPVMELFTTPLHPYTRGLLESTPLLSGVVPHRLSAVGGAVPGLRSIPRGCRFSTRCRLADELCTRMPIQLRPVHTQTHSVRCIKVGKVGEQ